MSVSHGFLGGFGIEEQAEGLVEEVLGVHPCVAELVVGVFLHGADALLVEELHIVACRAIEEVVGAHAEPEEVDAAVGVGGIVIDIGQRGGCEGTVGTEIGELVEVHKAARNTLVAAAREAANGTMIGVVDGAIVTLDIRHKVVHQVLAEHIHAEAHRVLRRCGQQLEGIAVGQHDDHFPGLSLSHEVVEDIVHAAYLIIDLFGVGGSADEIEHGVLLGRGSLVVVRRREIDDGVVGAAETPGIVVDVLDLSVGHVPDVVGERTGRGGDFEQAVLESLIGEILRVLRVHHADAVHNEAVGIHVGSCRSEGDCPQAFFVALHGVATGKLHIDLHVGGVGVVIIECDRAVVVAYGGGLRLLLLASGQGAEDEGHRNGKTEWFHFHSVIYLEVIFKN